MYSICIHICNVHNKCHSRTPIGTSSVGPSAPVRFGRAVTHPATDQSQRGLTSLISKSNVSPVS